MGFGFVILGCLLLIGLFSFCGCCLLLVCCFSFVLGFLFGLVDGYYGDELCLGLYLMLHSVCTAFTDGCSFG